LPKPSTTHSKISGLGSDSKFCESQYNDVVRFRAPVVSETKVAAAEEVLRVEEELIANTRSKESFLECSKTNIAEKLIGFRFGM
jgi:hypothetical protein